jgi:hypothetical protein
MNNPPQVSVWLDVPDGCRMQGEFTGDRDIHITLGQFGSQQNLLFERAALERFAKLANELLALPLPDNPRAALPVLLPGDEGWTGDKALIAELSKLNTRVAKYVLQHLDADAGRAEPITVEDERALAKSLALLAATLQERAERRAVLGKQPLAVEGTVTPPAVTGGDRQAEPR